MEHAHIKELEQSLLFEKTKADKLQRELEDTRVMDSVALSCALFCREREGGERDKGYCPETLTLICAVIMASG